MADDRPIVVADQANTSASATTILADLAAIIFLLCLFVSYLMTDDQPIFVVDQANTGASASTILADLTAISFLLCFCDSNLLADDQPIVVADQAICKRLGYDHSGRSDINYFCSVFMSQISWTTIIRLL